MFLEDPTEEVLQEDGREGEVGARRDWFVKSKY